MQTGRSLVYRLAYYGDPVRWITIRSVWRLRDIRRAHI